MYTRRRDVSVLVADDHSAIRENLRDLLQDSGMRVVGEAADGREAVRLCGQLCPEIVLLDISMPLLNGFEAAQEIAILSPATKIIFLTGHSLKEYVREAFRVGAVAFVTKKQAPLSLVAAIEAVLEGKTYVSDESAA
jgi:DNA-binding NarL/FixJ family response regulator